MNSIQIGRAASAPCSRLPSDFFSSNPIQTPTVMSGIEADEPRVGVVVHGAGLAGERPLCGEAGGSLRRSADQNAPQQVRHHVRGVRPDDVHGLGAVLLEQVPAAVEHSQHLEWLHPDALIGEDGVRARHLEQRRVARAKRNRQIWREVLLESKPLRVGEDVPGSKRVHHLDGRHVARLLERVAQRDRAFELVIVIVRAVNLTVPGGVADRRVHQDRRGREPAIDRRGVDDRLEGRPELPVRLHRPVELAAVEAPPAHHRLDLAGTVIERDERALGDRRLVERHRRRVARLVQLGDRDLDEVSRREQIRRRRATRPRCSHRGRGRHGTGRRGDGRRRSLAQ